MSGRIRLTIKELANKERFQRIFAHKEADRIPVVDSQWATLILA